MYGGIHKTIMFFSTDCPCLYSVSFYCKYGNFREGFISRNFADAKFRENKALAKWRNHYIVNQALLAILT